MTVPFWLAVDAPRTFGALRLGRGHLELVARRRLASLLRDAAGAGFHAERLRAVGIRDLAAELSHDPQGVLAALPTSTKLELREAGRAALIGGRVRESWRSSLSSGSSGEPFRVYYDPRAWATLKYLVKLRARAACGAVAGERAVLIDAGGRPGARGPLLTINALLPAESIAQQLERWRPRILVGLPSVVLEAGRMLEARGTRLDVRSIFTGGELLEPAVRQALSAAYNARVFDVYGTSETKEIAWECALGSMHVNADVVQVEVLGDDGEPLPNGEEGDIVATVLVNRAMPLLRYRTGDRGNLVGGRCPCGLDTPLLGVVTGRAADMLTLAGGRRLSPYALTCALEQVGELARYQVAQLTPARLSVRAVLAPGADPVVATARVGAALRAGVAAYLEADVEFVDRLAFGPNAKFRVVQPASSSSTEHP